MTRARENADLPVAMTESGGNVGIGTATGDVTSDGTASRTYVTIQGTANRGRLNLGSTASSGADVGTLGFTNGANTVASISVDSDSGSQTAGKMNLATAGSVRMTVDSGGRVTTPVQPHFQGWFNATFGAGTSVGTRITNNIHVKENTGNMFNSSNYRWTVPVAGMYMLHLQYLKANNTSASHHVDWSVNGQGANSTYRVRASEGATYDQPSGTWIFYLQANDYLELYHHGSGGIHDYHASIIVRLMG